MRFNYPSFDFKGGKVWAPLAVIKIPGNPDTTKVTQLSYSLTAPIPQGFRFHDRFTGQIEANFYRSDAGVLQLRDFGRNVSDPVFQPFNNNEPDPPVQNMSEVKASISSTTWCPGVCISGGQKIVGLNVNYLDTRMTTVSMVSKAEWFALSPLGDVYPLGKQTTPTITSEGTGTRFNYQLDLDLSDYCGPSGPAKVFSATYSADFKWILKPSTFFDISINAPNRYSNNCLRWTF
jgi:hypothetical protein